MRLRFRLACHRSADFLQIPTKLELGHCIGREAEHHDHRQRRDPGGFIEIDFATRTTDHRGIGIPAPPCPALVVRQEPLGESSRSFVAKNRPRFCRSWSTIPGLHSISAETYSRLTGSSALGRPRFLSSSDDRLNIHRGEAEQRVSPQPLLGRSEHPVHRQTPVPRVFAGTFQFSSCLSPAFLRKSSPPVPASVSSGRRPTSVGCQHTWTHALHIGG